MTRYTLAVTWADGRTERHRVPELGAVITMGPVASGIGPERFPVHRADGPTIAVAEVWGAEIPAIVASEDTGEPDLDVTPLSVGFDLRAQGMAVALPAGTRVVRFDRGGAAHTAIGDRATLRAALTAAGYTLEAEPDRETYLARFGSRVEAVRFEEQVLGIGSEFLPPCAVAVRDGAEPSAEYWRWLIGQHAAVEAEAPQATDTTRPLADQVRTAIERVRERQAGQLATWSDLYVSAGRALEAASRGDRGAALAHIEAAADSEYEVCGDCETMGQIEGAEVAT
jgi:hypothetical protein